MNTAVFTRHDISEAVKFYPVKRSHKILARQPLWRKYRGVSSVRTLDSNDKKKRKDRCNRNFVDRLGDVVDIGEDVSLLMSLIYL